MKWVGLTGGLGTGKSTVGRFLLQQGIPVLDADLVARQVLEPGGPAFQPVLQEFGQDIVTTGGVIDRQRLARKVFGQPDQLQKLETIIHPFVQEEIKRQKQWLQDQGTLWAVYDVPLLFEKNLQQQFDFIVVVSTNERQQIERIKARNPWTDEEIRKRLQAQIPLKDKEQRADYVLRNDADQLALEKQVATLVQMLNDRFHKEDQ